MMDTPRQGDIYTVLVGNEPHFVIVVSEEQFNRGGFVTVLLVTSRHFETRSKLPNCVVFRAGSFCFTKNCVAQAESLTQLERDGLLDFKGSLDGEHIRNLVRAVGVIMGAECEPGACC